MALMAHKEIMEPTGKPLDILEVHISMDLKAEMVQQGQVVAMEVMEII
ncbi:hypothetical protein GRO02_007625 [Campylobacter jejuni]|uniref:Uncharacterized protein n=1 Tax=Campylobacter jejuni TaxID=197 RepID=A0A6F9MU57_CAMJU|nr:hypothetical protein [Campylobacter coli]NHG51428.1 hypothetical protein [Campylobacter coli]NHH49906.1 hypothetical protein [Campylobacter coli]